MQTEPDGEQLTPNPVDTGVAPAESPTAVAPESPEPDAETSTGDDTADESQAEREKPRSGFQRRISELTRAQRELREQLAAERAEKQMLLERALKKTSEGEPKRDQFETWDEYERAHIDWTVDRKLKEATERHQAEAAEQARREQATVIHSEWEGRLDEAREKYDDIDEYVDVVGERLNPVLAEAIKASEKGPELVRYLGQHPKELARITSLQGVRAVYALANLETKVTARPKASTAPNPATPVKTVAAPTNALRDDAPIGDWMKARQAELGRR